MKLFSAQSIDRSACLFPAAGFTALAVAAACAFTFASCVSDPPAAPEPVPQSTAVAVETPGPPVSQSAREVPSIISSMRVPEPAPHVVIATLAVPGLPPPPVLPPVIPTEITVLSTMPAPAAGTFAAIAPAALPEPAAPVPAPVLSAPSRAIPAPAAPSALPEPKTAIPAKPATVAPAVKPAATPAAKPAATPAPAKPETPKTPKTAEAVPVPETITPAPAVVLPATPPSQARSVDAAGTQPVAETRIETVRGERFELRFPGTGWIYLGDEEGKEGLRYETRRFETTQAVFSMNPETAGEYLLRFQRQNPVDQATETSLVRVVVTERASFSTASAAQATAAQAAADTAKGAVKAASAATASATAPADSATAAASIPETARTASGATAPAAPAPADPASLIKLAKTELEAKRIQGAIEALDRYLALFPYGNDEVFYLYGLAYEQDTPFRDIKKSWDYYRRVRDEYPRSARWTAAADRIAYLEKHYFGLR